ncbi:hypothetical protein Thiowin_01966 [Thiorhodovibrio winogradskyi]|uniref:Uncharacterized protein n=1 Tax=Thiorhodovibrio winogradskyi TaxID=77007 RepID=A0ABZ0S910_9GAMM
MTERRLFQLKWLLVSVTIIITLFFVALLEHRGILLG